MNRIKRTSLKVIPAKAGIQKLLTSLGSRLRGSDQLILISTSLQWLFSVLFITVMFPTVVHAWSEEFVSHFKPYITLQEEYNSNIDLTPNRDKRDDFITTISPGLKFSTAAKSPVTGEFRQTPTAEEKYGMDLDFRGGFSFYAQEHEENYTSLHGTLNAWHALTPKLQFKVRDYLVRSNEIREADYSPTAIQSEYLLSRTNKRVPYIRNVFEPSMQYQFGKDDVLSVNYRNNVYRINSRTSDDSTENFINPRISYWFDIRNGVSFEYGLTLGNFQRSPDLVGYAATGRYTHRFNPRTSLFGEYTFLMRNFESPSVDYDVYRPSLGMEHAFSPTLNAKIQMGYFWQNPEQGSTKEGFFYDTSLIQRAEKTTYTLTFQGGYAEDYFTAENLGFTKYHRVIGAMSHRLKERITVGLSSTGERAKYNDGRTDRIWGVKGDASYQVLKWLTISLEGSHRENHSNVDTSDYSEYRGMLVAKAIF